MSTPPKPKCRYVTPHTERWSQVYELLPGSGKSKLPDVADRLGISLPTLKKLLGIATGLVREDTICAAVTRLARLREYAALKATLGSLDPMDMVIRPHTSDLPTDAECYERIRHGYFMRLNPQSGGQKNPIECVRETISLKRIRGARGHVTRFEGEIHNHLHGRFGAEAALLAGLSFSIQAINEKGDAAFTAVFTTWLDHPGQAGSRVLVGVWVGKDLVAQRHAVYRMFCSETELTDEQLADLVTSSPIAVYLDGPWEIPRPQPPGKNTTRKKRISPHRGTDPGVRRGKR